MWIRRKRFEALVRRVDDLERAVNMRPVADGPVIAWPYVLDGIQKPTINDVVAELAKLAGVGYDFGKQPGIVSKKK